MMTPSSACSSVVTIDMQQGVYADKLSSKAMINRSSNSPSVTDWGFPGHLSAQEYAIFKRFQQEMSRRDEEFRRAIFCFGSEEEESFALCRWLRARKFDLAAVIKMVESAVQMRRVHSKHDFYPDAKKALGVEPSVYISQYPQLYCGHCKGGYPLFISKPGVLNVSGLECITTMDGVLRYHWHAMIHQFGENLRARKMSDPNFNRFEVVCVIDLENLAVSNVGKRPLNIIKLQSEIDSLCFPETLHKFFIINAPSAFPMIWNIIKGWVDTRTAEKVEILSSRSKWEPRLLEFIDKNELPCDYGGTGIISDVSLEMESKEAGVLRQYVTTLDVRKSAVTKIMEVKEGEEMEIFAMTRSLRQGEFTFCFLSDNKQKDTIFLSPWKVLHFGKGIDEESPTRVTFPRRLKGPCMFQLKVNCNTGPWSSESFLVGAKVRHLQDSKQRPHNKGAFESLDISGSSSKGRETESEKRESIEPFDSDFAMKKVLPKLPPSKIEVVGSAASSQTSEESSTVLKTTTVVEEDYSIMGCLGWSCGAFWK